MLPLWRSWCIHVTLKLPGFLKIDNIPCARAPSPPARGSPRAADGLVSGWCSTFLTAVQPECSLGVMTVSLRTPSGRAGHPAYPGWTEFCVLREAGLGSNPHFCNAAPYTTPQPKWKLSSNWSGQGVMSWWPSVHSGEMGRCRTTSYGFCTLWMYKYGWQDLWTPKLVNAGGKQHGFLFCQGKPFPSQG